MLFDRKKRRARLRKGLYEPDGVDTLLLSDIK